jgi:hypothetical protein
MATFTVSGNCIAVNARLRLRSTAQIQPEAFVDTYSDANGNYTFSNVAPGNYQIIVDLGECITAPYNSGYSYRNPQGVLVAAANQSGINFTPVLLTAANPNYNAF